MRSSTFDQFAIVRADSAAFFTEELNETIRRLKDSNPVVHFSESIPFYAQIKYTVSNDIPETLEDEYALKGASFVCSQCPYFAPRLNDNGSVDRRCRRGYCMNVERNAEPQTTFRDMGACETLYELIKEGRLRLCFSE